MPARPKKSTGPRATVEFSPSLERNLVSYVTAAGAAGLALSAAAPQAAARIVYTPANITVNVFTGTTLDVNNDGIPDFGFGLDPGFHSSALAIHPLVTGNAVLCGIAPCAEAMAGNYGQAVGPFKGFQSNSSTSAFSGGGVFMAIAGAYGSKTYFFGPWANVKNHYVGLRFMIAGKVHYGWARMSVGNWDTGGAITISGYAYDTIPNHRIIEGHTSGPVEINSVAPRETSPAATLGILARGADAMQLWRRPQQ
jgi:hypothetical protein